MKLLYISILLLFCLGCHQVQVKDLSNGTKLGIDTTTNIYSVYPEDSSMNLAIASARKTIKEFDTAFKSNNSSYSEFAVKKRYKTPDDGGEHMWIAVIDIHDESYKGIVNNDAEQTTEVKYGDTVTVRKDEITDWMYLDNDKLRGGFTIRAIRNKLNKKERLKMEKDSHFKIDD